MVEKKVSLAGDGGEDRIVAGMLTDRLRELAPGDGFRRNPERAYVSFCYLDSMLEKAYQSPNSRSSPYEYR